MRALYPGSLTDVPGLAVGHAHDRQALTGCTVVLCNTPCTVGGEVRGRAPGTRETALLEPGGLVSQADAVLLTGGSAFGLAAASGVMRYLEEQGRGYDAGPARVPIVPAAVLFDLGVGLASIRPDAAMGHAACASASDRACEQGNVGAGMGATVGKLGGPHRAVKGGLGMASLQAGRLVVSALAAVNAMGQISDPETGEVLAGVRAEEPPAFVSLDSLLGLMQVPAFGNTIIGVVACNAVLDQAAANRLAQSAQDGLARVVNPAHTLYDGDTIFSLATGEIEANPVALTALAAEVMSRAIANGALACEGLAGVPSAKEWRNRA